MHRKTLYLVDGNSYCYRAYYAISHLATTAGRPTGAIYGFVTMLNKLRNEVRPDYLTVCFDSKGPTLRHETFADYKVHRKPMPDELIEQMPVIKEIIGAYGIPIFQRSGYEADDIIATLAVTFQKTVDVYIVSSDKDMLQLVGKYVKIYNPQDKNSVVDEKRVFERFKVTPSQITDLLALTGDSSDNIPGVPGIGAKTAAELISAFGNLESILKNKNSITQTKRRTLLEQFSTQARLSKKLATVVTDVPLETELERLSGTGCDWQTLKRIFQELEFKSFHRDLLDQEPVDRSDISIQTVDTAEQLPALVKKIERSKELSLSIQLQNNKNPRTIESVAISTDTKHLYRIIINHNMRVAEVKKALVPVFKNRTILKIGYDIKTACRVLDGCHIYLEEPFFDIMIGAYLLEPGAGTRTLSEIAGAYVGRNIDARVQATEQLAVKAAVEKELKNKNLQELFETIEMPLLRVLASMEEQGITVNKKLLSELDKKIEKELNALTSQIYTMSGCRFNINSPKQLSEVLFNRLKLPVMKKGKSGPSTSADVLMRLSAEHALPAVILHFRELAKLKSTYVAGLLELIAPQAQRIHTSFNQAVTATGRLSSSAPNLQNIPVRTETGRQIRAVFVARRSGWRLVSADYSQIELRVLAHLSGDAQLIQAFQQKKDIHAFTASLIFNISKEKINDAMRDLAKRVNFGSIYGMGAYGLARDINASHEQAKAFIASYFQRYPSVKKYLDSQIEQARKKGYVTTLLNRRRYIPQINAKDSMQRSFAERMAMNTPIQGTAADLIKIAMINIHAELKKQRMESAMVLQVHDELVFDVPDNELDAVKELIKDKMEHVLILKVPIVVTLKTGTNWRDMK